jgi:hypothetical protein
VREITRRIRRPLSWENCLVTSAASHNRFAKTIDTLTSAFAGAPDLLQFK